jgi:hypothetical protein
MNRVHQNRISFLLYYMLLFRQRSVFEVPSASFAGDCRLGEWEIRVYADECIMMLGCTGKPKKVRNQNGPIFDIQPSSPAASHSHSGLLSHAIYCCT